MQEEMQQFYHQQVWKLIPMPAGKIAIDTKWILKNKRDARGIMVCNKARLVAQGHRQEEGINYDENLDCSDKYVKDMLKKFDMESVRTATTPYEVPKHRSKDEPDDTVNVHLYRSMIGSFIDDDPLPYASYISWEMVPSPLGSVHAYHNMARHTKHFTTLREILHMVERNDLQRLLGAVDALYLSEEPDAFALLLWGDLHVLFQSLDDKDALHFWHVSYPLSVGTLERMLKHGLEVSKLLVGGFSCWFSTTLQMVFSSPWLTAKKKLTHHEGTALSWLVQEQTTLGKDKSNPLTVGSLLKTTWSSIHHLLTDEVLTSPEQTATDQMLLSHDPAVLGVPAGFGLLLFGWLLLVLFMLLE
nr:retrovirus-related Pol polyprotein from transposon TNT 1-94 [Tanacetum cinerariifolium]